MAVRRSEAAPWGDTDAASTPEADAVPGSTLVLGGALLAASAGLELAAQLARSWQPGTATQVLLSAATPWVAALLLLAGALVLALGVRHEPGVAGRDTGRTWLIAAGTTGVMLLTVSWLLPAGGVSEVLSIVLTGIPIVVLVLWTAAALATANAGVLRGAVRWAIALVACTMLVRAVWGVMPFTMIVLDPTGASTTIAPAATVAAGAWLAVHGLRTRRVEGR